MTWSYAQDIDGATAQDDGKLTLTTGLRVENWKAQFNDSDSFDKNTNEILIGGKVGLNYQENENSWMDKRD